MNMSDCISIEGLRVSCIIGCNPEERIKEQEISVSVQLNCPLEKACTEDNLEYTLDYSVLALEITALLRQAKCYLIEAAAEKVASLCLENPLVKEVCVKVEKTSAIPGAVCASVSICRRRVADE